MEGEFVVGKPRNLLGDEFLVKGRPAQNARARGSPK